MATLVSVYSEKVTVLIAEFSGDPRDLLVQNLRILRAYDGPQIIIAWEPPVAVAFLDRIKLIRRKHGYPADITDGTEVYEGPASGTVYVDLDVDPNIPYYYTMFSELQASGEWVYGDESQVEGVSLPRRELGNLLWSKLPRIYRDRDRRLDKENRKQRTWERTELPEGGYIHVNEDGTIERGQLERFLYIFGFELDLIKTKIDALPYVFDVEYTFEDYIRHFAALVGWTMNYELPLDRQRQEVLNAVAIYKRKGTQAALEAYARAVTGLDVDVWPFIRNILISNRTTRFSVDFDNTAEMLAYGLPENHFGHSPDITNKTTYWPSNVGVFIQLQEGVPLTQVQVEKLARTLPEFSPVGIILVETVLDPKTYEDAYDTPAITEWWGDEIEESPSLYVESYGGAGSTDLVLTSNSEGEISNSMQFGALFDHIRTEVWWDEFSTTP